MNTEIKEAFNFLRRNEGKMSYGQVLIVKSLKEYYVKNKRLSEKQLQILFDIRKYL